jgi:hypothetical protein
VTSGVDELSELQRTVAGRHEIDRELGRIAIAPIAIHNGRLLYSERRNGRLVRRLWEGWFGRMIFWRRAAG